MSLGIFDVCLSAQGGGVRFSYVCITVGDGDTLTCELRCCLRSISFFGKTRMNHYV